MLTAKKALAASRVYTEETAIGMGALKGANCTIKSITKTGDLNTVIFEWTDTEGGTHENTMLVYDGTPGTPGHDGDDGFSPTIVVKSSTSTEYILTITDKNGSYDTPNLKGSGGSGGASAMSDLTDVDLTALANGSVLVYDSTAAKWEAKALSFADISDVDLAGITDEQILAWDATAGKFVPADNTGEEYTAGEGIEISQDNEISSKIVMYTGTKAAWDALPLADKKKFTHASWTDDSESGNVDSVPTENSNNLVKSGGVWSALDEKADKTDLDDKADIATTLAGYGITDAYTKTETGAAITAEIEKLDVSDAAVAGSYVTEVSEADGKISVVREAADAVPTESSNKMVKSGGVYAANEALTKELEDEAATRSAMGAKNILPFDLADIKALNTNGTWAGNVYTYRGVDFTVNSDGTILADGQATGGNASIKVFAASSSYEMLGKKVILNGCPSGGSATTYRIQAYRMGSADGSTGTYFDDGEGTIAFDALNNASDTVGSFAVAVYENATVTNLLFKPMVRLASDSDATYQPYAKTNQELTAENEALTNNINVNGSKNVLASLTPSGTYLGITISRNESGDIVVNGTATASPTTISLFDRTFKHIGEATILKFTDLGIDKTKKYVFSRAEKVSNFRYNIRVMNGTTQVAEIELGNDNGLYTVIDFSQYTCDGLKADIVVANGTTITNKVFSAMLCLESDYDLDPTYQPYAKTNRELTENIGDLSENGIDRIAMFDWGNTPPWMNSALSANTLDDIIAAMPTIERPSRLIIGTGVNNTNALAVDLKTKGLHDSGATVGCLEITKITSYQNRAIVDYTYKDGSVLKKRVASAQNGSWTAAQTIL